MKFIFTLISFFFLLPVNAQYKYGKSLVENSLISKTSKKGVLYAGIDNILELNINDTDYPEGYVLLTNNGIVFLDSINFTTIPARAGLARLIVKKVKNSDTSLVGFKFFSVLNIPEPQIMMDTFCFSEQDTIWKNILINADSINIFFSKDIIGSDKWFSIVKYSVGYIYGGLYREYDFNGNKFRNDFKYTINRLGPGKEIIIKVFSMGEGKLIKELPIYRLVLY